MITELKKRIFSSILLISIICLIIVKGPFIFNFFLMICLVISLYEWHTMSKKKKYYYPGIIFMSLSFYTTYEIYNFENSNLIFLFILLICISTDLGGYVFGKFFKGPKLISISPNKTYSGVVGSYLFSTLFLTVFFKFTFIYNDIDNKIITYLMIIIISSISQLGDILVSYFKRLSKIKDTGKIIPGHGGLLDRIDGMIFAYPISYIILLTDFNFF